MQGDKVWVYPPEKKENGYPKLLQDEFPGIPSPLDAAVECHRRECQEEGIIFFQGQSGLVSKNLEQWGGRMVRE
jgi:hemopexin